MVQSDKNIPYPFSDIVILCRKLKIINLDVLISLEQIELVRWGVNYYILFITVLFIWFIKPFYVEFFIYFKHMRIPLKKSISKNILVMLFLDHIISS